MNSRKKDHLDLAKDSQVRKEKASFYYEPLFFAHKKKEVQQRDFFGKSLKYPFWVSSMTGGEARAKKLNALLAQLAEEFGLGMGLGSCRPFLEDRKFREDFFIRDLAPNVPLAFNLGIAQVEKYLASQEIYKVEKAMEELGTDILMVHINPLQEWFQPEGDLYQSTPFETLEKLKTKIHCPLGVKEVGQGFGPKSLKALLELEVDIIELAGLGGTNFTLLEQKRSGREREEFSKIGHSWEDMLGWLNKYRADFDIFPEVIVSGGIGSALEACKAVKKAKFPVLVGMAYSFLRWQEEGEGQLFRNFELFIKDWELAMGLLEITE